MFLNEYKEKKYNETFQSVYKQLELQQESDESYTVQDLENYLESLYANEGNDWTGRGAVKDIVNSATIAACEVFLTEWKTK